MTTRKLKPRSLYHRQWRAAKQAAGQVPHGTDNGYAGYGCRCDRCRLAHRDARRRDRSSGSTVHPPVKNTSPTSEERFTPQWG